MASTLRTFIALPISFETGKALFAMQQCLKRSEDVRARWVRPGAFHITLRFIGDTPQRLVPDVAEAVRRSAAEHHCCSLSFQGIGAFGSPSRPRVIWANISSGRDAVTRLAERINARLQGVLGDPPDTLAFRPHITLGRVRSVPDGFDIREWSAACQELSAGPELVRRVVLYQSRLSSQGSIYTELASLPLRS